MVPARALQAFIAAIRSNTRATAGRSSVCVLLGARTGCGGPPPAGVIGGPESITTRIPIRTLAGVRPRFRPLEQDVWCTRQTLEARPPGRSFALAHLPARLESQPLNHDLERHRSSKSQNCVVLAAASRDPSPASLEPDVHGSAFPRRAAGSDQSGPTALDSSRAQSRASHLIAYPSRSGGGGGEFRWLISGPWASWKSSMAPLHTISVAHFITIRGARGRDQFRACPSC